MRDEFPLGGGALTDGVVRLGETVRRPSSLATPRVREVLLHLERAGFEAAPRWLGVDDQDREILSWIEGYTFTERGRMHPYIGDPPERVLFSEELVRAAMRLLRRYHDAFDGEVICHGDYGPWNLVWRDLPVAIIDFDNVSPGDSASHARSSGNLASARCQPVLPTALFGEVVFAFEDRGHVKVSTVGGQCRLGAPHQTAWFERCQAVANEHAN